MSELKDYDIMDIEAMDDERLEKSESGKIQVTRVYIKSDVDAAIAELKFALKESEEARYEAGADAADYYQETRRLKRALWLARAERYKMCEFIAREEGNLCNQMSWSRILRERTYGQWVDQLLRIANLANKLQNKCRAKSEEYK